MRNLLTNWITQTHWSLLAVTYSMTLPWLHSCLPLGLFLGSPLFLRASHQTPPASAHCHPFKFSLLFYHCRRKAYGHCHQAETQVFYCTFQCTKHHVYTGDGVMKCSPGFVRVATGSIWNAIAKACWYDLHHVLGQFDGLGWGIRSFIPAAQVNILLCCSMGWALLFTWLYEFQSVVCGPFSVIKRGSLMFTLKSLHRSEPLAV